MIMKLFAEVLRDFDDVPYLFHPLRVFYTIFKLFVFLNTWNSLSNSLLVLSSESFIEFSNLFVYLSA